MTRNIYDGFLKSAARFPLRPALEVEGRSLTYSELRQQAERIAATLQSLDHGSGPLLTAVFAYRSVVAFSAILGVLLRGHGYVPLNRTFPPDRTRVMLERSGCRAVVVDEMSARQLDAILADIKQPLILLLPEAGDVSGLAARWPQHRVLGARDLVPPTADLAPVEASPDAIAYVLFTSGSTGSPKGVMVSQRNVWSYLDVVVPRYGLTEEDRCSQNFDLTFDVSVHDLFVTWEAGACLCCPTQKSIISPGKFIKDARLTAWFSVPSTPVFMKTLGMLKPGFYPSLRLSLFAGEALPVEVVKGWAAAVPNSVIENIYGPTELTITCTGYRWDNTSSPAECEQGVVPIGEPFEGMEALIVDEQLREVPVGVPGELIMAGPQVALGYLNDPEKTAAAFVIPPGRDRVFYRTGDRVRRAAADKPLVYLGRMDNQVKVLGHRVELGEIEAVVREESAVDGVVALGWPVGPAGAGGIEVFLQSEAFDSKALRARLEIRLPVYMVPRRIHFLPSFPLNANGKYDRAALLRILATA